MQLLLRAVEGLERHFGRDHENALNAFDELVRTFENAGNLELVRQLYPRALEVRERLRGPEHPETLATMHNLAFLLQCQGDRTGAGSLYKRAIAGCEKVLTILTHSRPR